MHGYSLSSLLVVWWYPLGPLTHQLLRTISLLGRWSTSGSDRGIAHFFTATRNSNEWVGEKEQTNKMNNTSLGLTQSARQGVMQHSAFPVCLCRQTLAWISSKTSPKLLGMPTYPDRSSSVLWTLSHANSSLCCLVSTAPRHPSPTASFEFLFPFLWLSSLPTSGHVEIADPNPLSGFAPKQTKGSSAWQTTYIVLQLFLCRKSNGTGLLNNQKIRSPLSIQFALLSMNPVIYWIPKTQFYILLVFVDDIIPPFLPHLILP